MESVFDFSSKTLLSYYSVLGEPGVEGRGNVQKVLSVLQVNFWKKGRQKGGNLEQGKGGEGIKAPMVLDKFYCWKCCRRATGRLQEYGKTRIFRNQLEGVGEREKENFTIFLKEAAAAINSKFTMYTKIETERMANEEMQPGAT